MSVENDNIKFMREKERSSNASVKNVSNSWQFKDDRNDPDQDRSRGCGGGGFNTPGRFVCWKRSKGADYTHPYDLSDPDDPTWGVQYPLSVCLS